MKHRAIEASSSHGLEALGIAVFASLANVVAALLLFLATFVRRSDMTFGMLETSKMFIGANLALMVLSIHHVEVLTHDCRWWGDFHHGNSDVCHQGFTLFCVATVAMGVSNCTLMYLASRAAITERRVFAKQLGYDIADSDL